MSEQPFAPTDGMLFQLQISGEAEVIRGEPTQEEED